MPKKKIEVVELNKKEEKILLEESRSALLLFWRRHRGLIFSLLLVLSLAVFGVSLTLFLKNIGINEQPIIKGADFETTLYDYKINISGKNSIDDDTAQDRFNDKFKNQGEVLLVKKIENKNFTVRFFSDGTAIKVINNGSIIIRVNALANGNYGIDELGNIRAGATTSTVRVAHTKVYVWGKVINYSDGSAEVIGSKMDMFVRNAKDVTDNYISTDKVTYLSNSRNVGNIKLNYYYDGTIEVIKNNKSYLVRTVDDLNITANDVTFKNNNQAEIYSTKKMADGKIIDYYTDGGAIIRDSGRTLSVRKSNSIIIKDNKIFEIVNNYYVEICKKVGNATYYTNGGAVVENYDGNTVYVRENSDIKYANNTISRIDGTPEKLVKETTIGTENVKNFEKAAVITTDKYIAIIDDKNDIIYDEDGNVKQFEPEDEGEYDDSKEFQIINNTDEEIKYRVVIERSPRTTIDVSYIRYQLSTTSETVGPERLDHNIWRIDNVADALNVKGTNYILIDSSIGPFAVEEVQLMLWTDYDTIPNSQMNKYFYGTIKLYAWTEEE